MRKLLAYLLVWVVVASSIMGITAPVQAESDTVIITILGTSDIHGRFVPWDYALDTANLDGSLTQIYTAIKQIRAENPNTILVDAGDAIQDNSVELFNRSVQHPVVVAMNAMGYDVWNMGNHEFNFGLDILKNITSNFKGQLLAGNIYRADGARFMPGYTIIERAGVKIGIIGMDTPLITNFEAGTDHLKGLAVKDPVAETKKAIAELQGKVDVIIGVMHMGEDNENGIPNTGVRDIANACLELTAIVAGHMHKLVPSSTVNGVLITEPYRYGMALSRIDLTFTKIDGQFVLTNKTASVLSMVNTNRQVQFDSDPELEQQLAPFHRTAREDANKPIGQLVGVNLVPVNEVKGIPSVQIGDTPLTDLFNEVQLYYSRADVAAISIDNDNARLDIGKIRKKDIAYNYQYAGGETTIYQVTGKDLKTYMEWAADYFNSSRPGDVTVSFNPQRRSSKYSTNDIFGGVKYVIDLTQPRGKRITNLTRLNGAPILDTDILKLGMNSYRMDQLTAKGSALEGKKFLKLWSSKEAYGEEQGTIRNLTIRYIQEVLNGQLNPKVQSNWKITGADYSLPGRNAVVELVNAGILSVPASPDNKYTNIAAINLLDPVTADEVTALCEKAGINPGEFAAEMTKGEFYTKLNTLRKK